MKSRRSCPNAYSEITLRKYQLAELRCLIPEAKSERFLAPNPIRLNLFGLPAELLVEKHQEEITCTRIIPEKEKKRPLRAEFLAHLTCRIDLIEPENIAEGSKKIGEAITEMLEYEPANIHVHQIVRLKYIVESTRIVIVGLPLLPGFCVPKANDYLMADEMPIAVLTGDKLGATHKGYYGVYYDPINKLVLFDYRKTRAYKDPEKVLKNFYGHLRPDGYMAHNNMKNQANITQRACMTHARSKFEHAKDNGPERATRAMSIIQKLYDIERQTREASLLPCDVKELRQQQAMPVLDEMRKWLKEQVNYTLPKSAVGGAIFYTLTLPPRLIRYIEDGCFQIDNNLIGNNIRPVALARKNYLGIGTHEAAQNGA